MFLLFVFVFFCFKQKTAYDMRISDWSSDVCSSDLLGDDRAGVRIPLGDALTLLDAAALVGHQTGTVRHLVAGALAAIAVDQHDLAVTAHDHEAEIGRASWWERVWQYG